MKKVTVFFRSQPVLVISCAAALITMFFIPPDMQYIGYCNFGVLAELFALMTAVAGLRGAGLFEKLTTALLKRAGTLRHLSQIFIFLCFFSSMLVTNDVALITFVPLTLMAFADIEDEKSRILTVVLETVAANLGSMMTPVGNPQNLFLFDKYEMSGMQFIQTMLPAGIASLLCLILLSFLIPKAACPVKEHEKVNMSAARTVVWALMFAVCVAAVFKLLPYWVCAAAAASAALILDRGLLLKVDYCLLATFVFFFVFVGNIARVDAVNAFFSDILKTNEVIVSALLSQVISNVPASVMLSGFTQNGTALLLGVNLGGLGTPIASMASLISLQFYRKAKDAKTGKYLAVFSAVNFGLLALLLVFCFCLDLIL